MGSCGKTCRRACWLNFDAHPAQDESDVSFRICSRDMWFTSLRSICRFCEVAICDEISATCTRQSKSAIDRMTIEDGGEDRNRTYLATCVATTVLKTARATRHPSLSGLRKTPNAQRPTSNAEFFAREARFGVRRLDAAFERPTTSHGLRTYKRLAGYFAFLIALTISSKSGHSPDSSLEWSSLPLARISKAPPLDGISVSDLMRSPSSRILVAKLTAFGV